MRLVTQLKRNGSHLSIKRKVGKKEKTRLNKSHESKGPPKTRNLAKSLPHGKKFQFRDLRVDCFFLLQYR